MPYPNPVVQVSEGHRTWYNSLC